MGIKFKLHACIYFFKNYHFTWQCQSVWKYHCMCIKQSPTSYVLLSVTCFPTLLKNLRASSRKKSITLISKWQFPMVSKLQLLLAWECFGSSYLFGKVSRYMKIGYLIYNEFIQRKYLQTSLGPNCNLPGALFCSLINIQIGSGRIWKSKALISFWLQQKWTITGSIWTILFGLRETFKSDTCHFCARILCQVDIRCYVQCNSLKNMHCLSITWF